MSTERLIVARYRLVSPVGQGGMGVVWRARDEMLGRDVAVKEMLLHTALSDAEKDMAYNRTLREARSAARLSHPGVVTIYDVVEDDGRPWIVMELLRARSLQEVIEKECALPPERVAAIGLQIVAALDAAHAVGVLHRDVKPSNVLLTVGDRVVLTDFGIAYVQGDTALTQTGQMVGSPGYMAPERLRGQQAMPASDLWGLGATLYAAVEGRPPFSRPDTMATLAAVLTSEPPPPDNAGPIRPLIDGLLQKDPSDRLTTTTATALLTPVANLAPGHQQWTRPTPLALSAPQDTPVRSAAGLAAYASAVAAFMSMMFGLLAMWRASYSTSKPPFESWFSVWALIGLVLTALTHILIVLGGAVDPARPQRRRIVRRAGLAGAGALLVQAGVFSVIGWAGYDLHDRSFDEWALTLSGAAWGAWLVAAGVIGWKRSPLATLGAVAAGVAEFVPVIAGRDNTTLSLVLSLVSTIGYIIWAILVGRRSRSQ